MPASGPMAAPRTSADVRIPQQAVSTGACEPPIATTGCIVSHAIKGAEAPEPVRWHPSPERHGGNILWKLKKEVWVSGKGNNPMDSECTRGCSPLSCKHHGPRQFRGTQASIPKTPLHVKMADKFLGIALGRRVFRAHHSCLPRPPPRGSRGPLELPWRRQLTLGCLIFVAPNSLCLDPQENGSICGASDKEDDETPVKIATPKMAP